MNNNDAVFEHIINQLRANNEKSRRDIVQDGWDKLREDNRILSEQVRDSSALVAELHKKVNDLSAANGSLLKNNRKLRKQNADLRDDIGAMASKLHTAARQEPEQAGCRKDDTQVEEPWIKWGCGKCPVPEDTIVDVKYRDGKQLNNLVADKIGETARDASYAFWKHDGAENDIVAYRVVGGEECKHDWEQAIDDDFRKCTKCGKVEDVYI